VVLNSVMPCLRALVSGFSLRKIDFDVRTCHVGSVLYTVQVEQVFISENFASVYMQSS